MQEQGQPELLLVLDSPAHMQGLGESCKLLMRLMSIIVHVQAFPQAAFLGELGQTGLPELGALGPGMDAFLQHRQQLLQRAGLAPPSAHHASLLPQPQQRPVSCTKAAAPLQHEETKPGHDMQLFESPVGGPLLALYTVRLAMLLVMEPCCWEFTSDVRRAVAL